MPRIPVSGTPRDRAVAIFRKARENVTPQAAERMSDRLPTGAVSNTLNVPSVSGEGVPRIVRVKAPRFQSPLSRAWEDRAVDFSSRAQHQPLDCLAASKSNKDSRCFISCTMRRTVR